jgi:hypothetical protein
MSLSPKYVRLTSFVPVSGPARATFNAADVISCFDDAVNGGSALPAWIRCYPGIKLCYAHDSWSQF